MRRECSVLVPSSFQIAIAADRVLERLMLNLNVVTDPNLACSESEDQS